MTFLTPAWWKRILDFLAALNTHSRYPDSQRDGAYTRSYRAMRLAVGILGIGLPILFIVGEAFFLRGGDVGVRGGQVLEDEEPLNLVGALVNVQDAGIALALFHQVRRGLAG